MFPERLRALRRGRHITLETLAETLNEHLSADEKPNTASQIGNWERGIRTPSYIEVKKIANYFNVSLDYLVGHSQSTEIDLAMLFLSESLLSFNKEPLDNQDRYEIFQLIDGYLHGKSSRQNAVPINHQEALDLDF
ncbi:helix-turn-helix domain-containing protein [Periweissella fabalis]|uniref:Helix-turn-helix transcriptional regulator n=1 Tax=Periweissella fabalis TaxID=1070421 RepID=A0A7X6N2L1_9LACO|nr:helix-turn-helix transcriptional regulator [Periweissella fabalis]MCM0599650.1 helix-turn-helix transcriptional regulator [Periweissella fabalis]NKZ23955.1 helix-turn-helix transcriptional regulator [Periweissella fabalis]